MIFPVLEMPYPGRIYVVLIIITLIKKEVSVNIIVTEGPKSSAANDALSIIACPTGYRVQRCECDTTSVCDGSYLKDINGVTTCHAQNAYGSPGIKAKVTCVQIEKGNERYKILKTYGKWPSATCPAGSFMTNCMIHSGYLHMYFQNYTIDGQTCKNTIYCSRGCTLRIVCQDVYCGNPGTRDYSIKSGTDYYFGDEVTYQCESGAFIMADKVMQSQTLRCQASGLWESAYDCRLVCDSSGTICKTRWEGRLHGVVVKDANSEIKQAGFIQCATSCRPGNGCISFTHHAPSATCWLNRLTIQDLLQYQALMSAVYYEYKDDDQT